MKSFAILPYTEKEYEKFSRYIRSAFHEKYILSDARYLDWQYGPENLLLAKEGDDIIGHFGFQDIAYKYYDRIADIRVLMNLYVQEQYRMTGVASLLAEQACEGARPLLVSGYTPLAEKLFSHLKHGWRNGGVLKRMMSVLDRLEPLLNGYRIPSTARTGAHAAHALEITEGFPSDGFVDECGASVHNRFPVTVLRSGEYITWRFIRHPFLKYRVLAAQQKGLAKGYLIWRIEEDQGFRLARIVDFFTAQEAESALLDAFLGAAKKASAHAADFFLSGAWYDAAFSDAGFFDVAGSDFEKFPILFSPISHKKTMINIGYDLDAPWEDCFFTKADGDQDRPNPH